MTKMTERFFCFVDALIWSFNSYDFLLAFFLLLWCYCFCSHFGVIIGPTGFAE